MVGETKIFSVCNPTAEDFSVVQNENFPTCKDCLQVRQKADVPFWNLWGTKEYVLNAQESTIAKNATVQNLKFYGWRI